VKDPGWLQTPLWKPEVTWEATPVSQLPAWTDAKRICVDVECRDDNLFQLGPGVRRGGFVCGVAFAIEGGPAHYLPIRHEGGGNLSEQHVWEYLRDQAGSFDGEVVFNSAPYDLDYLWENRVEFKRAKKHRDVQVAEPLLDELQKTYNLDAICARRGLRGKDEVTLRDHADAWDIDPKRDLWRLHAGAVGPYAIGDVVAPLPLLRIQEKEIDEQNLRETYDLESDVTTALVRMTRRGLRVDLDEMDRVEEWAKQRLADYIDKIHYLTGVRIASLSNNEEVARALKAHGLDVPTRTRKGTGHGTNKPAKIEASIQKLWLQQQTDEASNAVVSGREFAKLLGTYVAGFRKHLVGDRLHPSFKQLRSASDDDDDEGDEEGGSGARFGRVAAKHPNIQAQMKRSREIQKRWRKVIVPDEGKRWFKADLGQQEPRLTVHYAELCNLPGATRAGNLFRDDPCFDPYQLMVELCKTPSDTDLKKLRDDLKEVYLGRCYGMGGGKLAKKLKLPTIWKTSSFSDRPYEAAGPEAQEIINRFDRGVPYVKSLAKLCTKSAQAKKYIIALGNRRVRFELDENGKIEDEHKALNKLIQGSAAHQTKKALVALDAEGFPLQLTVHDEFGYSGNSEDEARRMGEITCDAVVIRVPFRCDIEAGPSYGELTKLFTVASKHTLLSTAA
jgi:DNA polymerase I-like protein with 3'-5' exonuclease and polymerase domains